MAAENTQVGKLECNAIEIGDGPSGLRFPERSGMSDLRAERNVEFAALRKQRIVAPVVGRQPPHPRQDAQPLETVMLHTPTQLAHPVHRSIEIDGRDADEAVLDTRGNSCATSSLLIIGPDGPCQAQSMPTETPARSISARGCFMTREI